MALSPKTPAAPSAKGSPQAPKDNSLAEFVVEIVKIVAIALAIVIPVRYFLVQPFIVRGASMEPTVYDREFFIIDEISFDLRSPQRGEVVVFRFPRDPDQYYIKRIIGLPGETVAVANGSVRITNADHPDGFVLDESGYLDMGVLTAGNVEVELEADEYFMMGDNRSHSSDSRVFGAVPSKYLIGRAWVRAFPFDRAGVFAPPHYDLSMFRTQDQVENN